jgi:hypothetical protein
MHQAIEYSMNRRGASRLRLGTLILGLPFGEGGHLMRRAFNTKEAQQMKRLFLTFTVVAVGLSLEMGCTTTKKTMQPAPAAAPQQQEIVTPAVTLPPDQQPSGAK